ncbi:MAG: hypothetical protein ACT4OJ_09525 [Bacteroidota bacterium]
MFISACGILAFAPVSFMLRALKNDIVALEYPINHFISQCIRNGEIPYWFNTWGMGFPLQGNLTWGIYSTPQLFFSSAFDYNIYTLHIEFLFFILLSGWSMYYLLKQFLVKDDKIAQLLAICYMLSGFMVGSTQWLLYVTAAAFVPLVIASLLKLLRVPSFKNSVRVAVCYTLMFTSVYAAFNIISTYSIAVFLAIWLWKHRKEKEMLLLRFRHLILTTFITGVLCFPCLYFTIELLNHLGRGNAIATDTSFFNSNYLHPRALSSMLFPFSSVRMGFANTEGTMLNTYAGLFLLALLPLSVWLGIKEKSRSALLMTGAAVLFLVISFGGFTPVRQAINLLPGFSYFRNPAIFRFYFILSLILFTAIVLQNRKLSDIISEKLFRYTLWLIAAVSLCVLLMNIKSLSGFSGLSLTGLIKNISLSQTLLVSSAIQLAVVIILITLIRSEKWSVAKLVFAGDLVINTLVCTPFFSVSSYSLPEVNNILKSEKGFPVQKRNPGDVPVTYTDQKGNTWHNINVFSKEVAVAESYPGPLVLKSTSDQKITSGRPLMFYTGSDSSGHLVKITLQRPNHIRAEVRTQAAGHITLLQNYYPGWKAYINGRETEIAEKGIPGITINIPAGESVVDFRYRRTAVWLSALLVHLVVILFGLFKLKDWIKKLRIRYSSPS